MVSQSIYIIFQTYFSFNVFLESRPTQRERPADSSDSDGEDTGGQFNPVPVCISLIIYSTLTNCFFLFYSKATFYQNVENF